VQNLHSVMLITLVIAIALTMLRLRSLLGVAILSGIYSLILAVVYTLLDAVDVAFTEAAVGAGVTLTLMLAAMSLTTRREAPRPRNRLRERTALAICCAAGAALLVATLDMPRVGDAAAPAHNHVAPRYLEAAPGETGVPNIVTAVLASYRGYDTLGEVTVIFTAGISVIALLWRWGPPRP